MVENYKEDVATIISDFDQTVVIKSDTNSYNDEGRVSQSWVSTTTANIDIQPLSSTERARIVELGMKKAATHMGYGYYDIYGVKLAMKEGYRFYVGTTIYEVIGVSELTDSHFEIYLLYVEGKA